MIWCKESQLRSDEYLIGHVGDFGAVTARIVGPRATIVEPRVWVLDPAKNEWVCLGAACPDLVEAAGG